MAVRRLRETNNMAALCRELGISRQLLYHWRDRLEPEQTKPDPAVVTEQQLRREILTLKQALGEKSLQVDFLQGALEKIEALRRGSTASGATASTGRSGK
jgi:transposase-like protein